MLTCVKGLFLRTAICCPMRLQFPDSRGKGPGTEPGAHRTNSSRHFSAQHMSKAQRRASLATARRLYNYVIDHELHRPTMGCSPVQPESNLQNYY
jgi:hypothetical protein